MHFDHVWLTTDEQISALLGAFGNASMAAKMLGRLKFPADAAHIRGVMTPWMKMPIAFVAHGTLSTSGERVVFVTKNRRLFGWRMRGVRADLSFDYAASELTSVEPAQMRSPVSPSFDLALTRIRTNHAPPLVNFLVCVSGGLQPKNVRAQNQELLIELQNLVGATTI